MNSNFKFQISNWPIRKTTPSSPEWPELLNQLKDPPEQLYFRGNWDPRLFEKSLAVVGSRRMTRYGEQVIENIVPSLVAEGVTIISGFMYGIDTKAHQECLDCGGKTVAVLGGGLDVLYPLENEKLYEQIVGAQFIAPDMPDSNAGLMNQTPTESHGLIISEYPANQQPQLWTFPQRNRIIASLSSLGVLVIEAGEKSGSLITTEIARKLKKPIFAVPGPITSSNSLGTNRLIKDGLAKMVLNANDIVGTQFIAPEIRHEAAGLINQTPTEHQILSLLSAESLTSDEIAQKLSLNIIEISQTLTMMSIKNMVEERNGKYFSQGVSLP